MAGNGGQPVALDFTVDKNNLYREESFNDFRLANIQQLLPIKADGSEDDSRAPIFIGRTQLTTPQGPVPIQAKLEATTLEEAMDAFPKAMEAETKIVVETLKKMQEKQQKAKDSRIIVPGMNN
jgi:hypothetical protein